MASKYGLLDAGLLVARLSGGFLAVHGFQKVQLYATDDPKWAGFVQFVDKMGFPESLVFAWAAVASELVGGILVLLGVYTRVAAAFCAITMFVAAFMGHAGDAFKERELALVYMTVMICLACSGAGSMSVDKLWRK